MDSYRYIHAKSSWMSAAEAFAEALRFADTGVQDGTVDALMRQGSYGDYLEAFGEPEAGTSDFMATIPMMYLIYNGIELSAKAFGYVGHPSLAPATPPKFEKSVVEFRTEFPEQEVLGKFVDTFTATDKLPQLFADFLIANDMTWQDFISARRYVNSTSFYQVIERYKPYVYKLDTGREFYLTIQAALNSIIPLIDDLRDAIDSEGQPNEKIVALKR